METSQIEIMLEVLNFVQGQLFNDAKVVDLGNFSSGAYVDLKCRNEDKIKIQIKYEAVPKEQSDGEN